MSLVRVAPVTWLAIACLFTTPSAARAQSEPAHVDSPRVREALPPEAQRVLLEADTFEVFLIACERDAAPDEETFHGYPVVKRVTLEPGEGRVRLLSRIYQGIDEGSAVALCFEPHHGVRARKGEQQVDLVICFECLQQQAEGKGVAAAGAIISQAAAAELDRLLGPIADRRFSGRTLGEWHDHLRGLPAAAALAPEDEAGVVTIAESLGWGERGAWSAVETLSSLERRAAPAAPALGGHLGRADADPRLWECAARLLKQLGPAAAPGVPGLIALLERDLSPLIERARRRDESDEDVEPEGPMLDADEAVELRVKAIDALGEIGPDAAAAVPLLEKLAAVGGDEGQAATDALALIRRPRKDAR